MRPLKRSSAYDNIVSQLVEAKGVDQERPAFETYRDLYVFCASLAYEKNLHSKPKPPFVTLDTRAFVSHDNTLAVMLAIALTHSKDPTNLQEKNEDRVADIFEEYVNAGLGEVEKWCNESFTDYSGILAIISGLLKDRLLGNDRTGESTGTVF